MKDNMELTWLEKFFTRNIPHIGKANSDDRIWLMMAASTFWEMQRKLDKAQSKAKRDEDWAMAERKYGIYSERKRIIKLLEGIAAKHGFDASASLIYLIALIKEEQE